MVYEDLILLEPVDLNSIATAIILHRNKAYHREHMRVYFLFRLIKNRTLTKYSYFVDFA